MKHLALMVKTALGWKKNKKQKLKKKKRKNIIQEKNNVYKSYRHRKTKNDTHYLNRLQVLQENLYNATEVSKLNYYSQITYKLTHIQINTKAYWTLLKKFFNNKKIPLIPSM